eukprot:1778614-Pleurochrysis_carterae.AAC.1
MLFGEAQGPRTTALARDFGPCAPTRFRLSSLSFLLRHDGRDAGLSDTLALRARAQVAHCDEQG